MENLVQIKAELYKFGLSATQTKIYMLLVQQGELRVQEIVEHTKIPRSSVYDSLRKLYELGIAEEVVYETYKKIRPYSVGTMRHGLDEKMLKLKRLSKDLDDLERSLPLTFEENTPDVAKMRFYKGRSGAQQLFWNSLKAKNTAYVFSDWGRGRYVGMKYYERFVAESRERNIKEKVIINPTAHALESIRQYTHPDSEISRTHIEDIRAIEKSQMNIIGDTIMYDNVYAQAYLKGITIHGFEVESSQFVEMQRSIFETLWHIAKPITEYL